VAQVVECLLCKYEDLNSNSGWTKKKKNLFSISSIVSFKISKKQLFMMVQQWHRIVLPLSRIQKWDFQDC
jgi:hypothetical protein